MEVKVRCSLCGIGVNKKDVKYLSIFVNGSEGIDACLHCRMLLTEFARALQSTATRSKIETIKRKKSKKE